jgi:hypothetical protein
LYQRTDGSLCEVDEDGWLEDDELPRDDAINIKPTSLEVFEAEPIGMDGCEGWWSRRSQMDRPPTNVISRADPA